MNKKFFIKTMEELKSLEDDMQEVHCAMRKLDSDFGGFYVSRFSTLILSILQEVMNDKNDWISYFIYELDWGTKWKHGMVTDGSIDIKLKTLDDLYLLLK